MKFLLLSSLAVVANAGEAPEPELVQVPVAPVAVQVDAPELPPAATTRAPVAFNPVPYGLNNGLNTYNYGFNTLPSYNYGLNTLPAYNWGVAPTVPATGTTAAPGAPTAAPLNYLNSYSSAYNYNYGFNTLPSYNYGFNTMPAYNWGVAPTLPATGTTAAPGATTAAPLNYLNSYSYSPYNYNYGFNTLPSYNYGFNTMPAYNWGVASTLPAAGTTAAPGETTTAPMNYLNSYSYSPYNYNYGFNTLPAYNYGFNTLPSYNYGTVLPATGTTAAPAEGAAAAAPAYNFGYTLPSYNYGFNTFNTLPAYNYGYNTLPYNYNLPAAAPAAPASGATMREDV